MVGLGLAVALQVKVAELGSVTVSWRGLRVVIVGATEKVNMFNINIIVVIVMYRYHKWYNIIYIILCYIFCTVCTPSNNLL